MSSQRYQRVRPTPLPLIPIAQSRSRHKPRISLEPRLMYTQVNAQDDEDDSQSYPLNPTRSELTPHSPPPSFRSRSASPSSRRLLHDDPLRHNEDQTLADAFGDDGESDDDDEPDDRQRLMRASPDSTESGQAPATTGPSSGPRTDDQNPPPTPGLPRRQTVLPTFTTSVSAGGRSIATSNDGVFANLAAKPQPGEKTEDLPPVSDPLSPIRPFINWMHSQNTFYEIY